MKTIFSNKQYCAQMLFKTVRATNCNMLSALVSHKISPELTYAGLVQALEEHFCPKKNVIVLHYKFISIYQGKNQTIQD